MLGWKRAVVVVCALASCRDASDGTGDLDTGGTTDTGDTGTSDSSSSGTTTSAVDTTAGDTSTGDAIACGESQVASAMLSIAAHARAAIAGDIDADGDVDALVAVPGYVEDGDPVGPGRVRVVLGPLEARSGDVVDQPGFDIVGEHEDHLVGGEIAAAGDVNGDGLDDVIVGISRTCDIDDPCSTGGDTDDDCETPCAPGPFRVYVVHGKTDTDDVQLATVTGGTGGFAIESPEEPDALASASVAALGDANGDGLTDLAIATRTANGMRGRVYVVFGRSETSIVDLADVAAGDGGFAIDPEPESGGYFPAAMAAAGDVDGDGTGDIVVSDYVVDDMRGYVVFSGEATATVALADVAQGTGGFVLASEPSRGVNAGTGTTLAGLGDLDGDGLSEVGISAPNFAPDGETTSGRVYVVHGRSDTAIVDLAEVAMGTGGFAIDGTNGTGTFLDGGADHDGDGVPDVLVADVSDGVRTFVVAGKADGARVRLGEAGSTAITPPDSFDPVGDALVPDLDCDGRGDLVLQKSSWTNSGVAFVLE